MKVLTGIILLPIVLIVLGVLFCEANKYYWDRKIDGWCEINPDEIFERIAISDGEALAMMEKSGHLYVRTNGFEANGDAYYVETKDETIREKNPKIYKTTYSVIRDKDKKIMVNLNYFSRQGGIFQQLLGIRPAIYVLVLKK